MNNCSYLSKDLFKATTGSKISICTKYILMSPNKDETVVHGCHYRGDLAVRMRKVLAITRKW